MAAMFYVVSTPLMFAVCMLPYSLILVTLLVLALLMCAAVDRIRWKAWHQRAEALALARRADEQHAATLRGELYGTYGPYMPAREFLPASASRAVDAAALAQSAAGAACSDRGPLRPQSTGARCGRSARAGRLRTRAQGRARRRRC
jgi:hypothetical protein